MFRSTGDPTVTNAPLTPNAPKICNSNGDTSSAARTMNVKLNVSQINVAPEGTTGVVYNPNTSFIPSSTVRQPAAPAP